MCFESAGRTVTEADIVAFAGLSGDFNQLHVDEEWVKGNTPFRSRIAHGLLVLSVSSGLRTPGYDALNIQAYLSVHRDMVAPTYPGDTIVAVNTVTDVRPSGSRPGHGVVHIAVEVRNQEGECVQRGTDTLLIGPREA
nr:MaoC/PaaZ C-terminal domain-containing protein [Sediminivirga luteola]